MAADRHDGDSTREFRLEGVGLLLGGGFLLALLVGAFYLGRWFERQVDAPAPLTVVEGGPLAQVAPSEPDAEAAEGLTHFDTLEGGEKQAEAAREIRRPSPAQPASGAPDRSPVERATPVQPEGRFYVQVLALRDQRGAAEVIESLGKQGYGVRLFPEREGTGTLYKVRVGGFTTRGEAAAARDRLRKEGHPGAFVWPSD